LYQPGTLATARAGKNLKQLGQSVFELGEEFGGIENPHARAGKVLCIPGYDAIDAGYLTGCRQYRVLKIADSAFQRSLEQWFLPFAM
jgi:hypothetical protein